MTFNCHFFQHPERRQGCSKFFWDGLQLTVILVCRGCHPCLHNSGCSVFKKLPSSYNETLECSNYKYMDGNIIWDECSTLIYPTICSVAGFVAVKFGVRGDIDEQYVLLCVAAVVSWLVVPMCK